MTTTTTRAVDEWGQRCAVRRQAAVDAAKASDDTDAVSNRAVTLDHTNYGKPTGAAASVLHTLTL